MAGRCAVAFALVGCVWSLAGCGGGKPVAAGPQGTYDQHCARCHAQAGQPGGPGIGNAKGPPLSDVPNRPGRSKEWVAAYIRDPKSVRPDAKMMPAFKDTLTEQQINELAEWLTTKK
ncbi:MAG: cytochrome c [Planctomycetes bacterium]|nr:cytochrome c [Planctomycetota bacterium]